jgi:hypothetical protein
MNTSEFNEAMKYFYINSWNQNFYGLDLLNDTPLNSAIIAGIEVVNAFKKKNKIQIVNTIFLTDGCSDAIINAPSLKFVITDPVAKKHYNVKGSFYATDTLLKVFKDRTESNTVGFYLRGETRHSNIAGEYFREASDEVRMKKTKEWKENKFLEVKSSGYDSYFIVNTDARPNNALVVVSGMKRSAILSAFNKYNERKTINRPFLKKFVDLVVKQIGHN